MEYQSFFIVFKKYTQTNGLFEVNSHIAHGFAQITKTGKTYDLSVEFLQDVGAELQIFADCYFNTVYVSGKNSKIELGENINVKSLAVVCPKHEIIATNCNNFLVQKYLNKNKIIEQKNADDNIFSKIFGSVPITYFFDYIKSKLAKIFLLGSRIDFSDNFGESEWTCINYSGTKKVVGVIYDKNFPSVIAIGTEISSNQKFSGHICEFDSKFFQMIFLSASTGNFLEFCDGIWR